MAQVVADRIAGGSATFTGADASARLKLLGIEVASVGDPHAVGDEVVAGDATRGTWQKVVLDGDRVLGAVLVGDTSAFATLAHHARTGSASTNVTGLLFPTRESSSITALPDEAGVCTCHNVSCGALRGAIRAGSDGVGALKRATKAGTGCGSCVPLLQELLDAEVVAAGGAPNRRLCAHFDAARAAVRGNSSESTRSFSVVERFGSGHGCSVQTRRRLLASLESGYILDGEQAALKDTNDLRAHLQRNGTYSIVPRTEARYAGSCRARPGRATSTSTRITSRNASISSARVEQLPRSGSDSSQPASSQAARQAVRTVKSCVGSTAVPTAYRTPCSS